MHVIQKQLISGNKFDDKFHMACENVKTKKHKYYSL